MNRNCDTTFLNSRLPIWQHATTRLRRFLDIDSEFIRRKTDTTDLRSITNTEKSLRTHALQMRGTTGIRTCLAVKNVEANVSLSSIQKIGTSSALYMPERRRHRMQTQTESGTQPRIKMFLDIPTAAEMAGFSLRHFRRIIEEDQIPIVQIGRKFFILGRDFSSWQEGKRVRRPS